MQYKNQQIEKHEVRITFIADYRYVEYPGLGNSDKANRAVSEVKEFAEYFKCADIDIRPAYNSNGRAYVSDVGAWIPVYVSFSSNTTRGLVEEFMDDNSELSRILKCLRRFDIINFNIVSYE